MIIVEDITLNCCCGLWRNASSTILIKKTYQERVHLGMVHTPGTWVIWSLSFSDDNSSLRARKRTEKNRQLNNSNLFSLAMILSGADVMNILHDWTSGAGVGSNWSLFPGTSETRDENHSPHNNDIKNINYTRINSLPPSTASGPFNFCCFCVWWCWW